MGHHTPHDVHAAGWRGERRAERFYIDRGYAVSRGTGAEVVVKSISSSSVTMCSPPLKYV